MREETLKTSYQKLSKKGDFGIIYGMQIAPKWKTKATVKPKYVAGQTVILLNRYATLCPGYIDLKSTSTSEECGT